MKTSRRPSARGRFFSFLYFYYSITIFHLLISIARNHLYGFKKIGSIMTRVLLIHPPVAKPGEPPAGIARLKGALDAGRIPCSLMDANLEGIRFLLHGDVEADDTWTQNAVKNTDRHIHEIRSGSAFNSIGHYNRIVNDLNRLMALHGRGMEYHLSLADCTHGTLSPVRSQDLIRCAENPENDPFFEYYSSRLLPDIGEQTPGIIGLSVNFLSQSLSAFAMLGLIRKRFPGIQLILGGGLVTSWMSNPGWKDPFSGLVDHCVAGPGEAFFLSLLKAAEPSGGNAAPHFGGLAGLPYLSPGFVLPYNTSSGCFWRRCRFCPEQSEGGDYRPIPHGRVMEDLRMLKETTAPSLVHFLDNALSESFLDRFTENPVGIPWYGYVRFSERLTDPDYCRRIKESGCVMLKLGLESGDQAVLDSMDKGIRIETASKVLRNLKQAGIPAYVYLLFGTPYESEDSARRTMHFVLDHHETIGYMNPAIFNMPVSSGDAAIHPVRPFSQGDLSLYVDFEHPRGWNRSAVRHFLDREFRRQPLISPILARTPKLFTSNHAPFFCMR